MSYQSRYDRALLRVPAEHRHWVKPMMEDLAREFKAIELGQTTPASIIRTVSGAGGGGISAANTRSGQMAVVLGTNTVSISPNMSTSTYQFFGLIVYGDGSVGIAKPNYSTASIFSIDITADGAGNLTWLIVS